MATETFDVDHLVTFRSPNVDKFKRNYLKQVVCELRFPILLGLGRTKPPAAFAAALRKDYPHFDVTKELTLSLGSDPGSDNFFMFRSSKGNLNVTLKPNLFSLETTSYHGYADFKKRAMKVIDASAEFIDSDFFTRVGLRFVNVIETKISDPLEHWVNAKLVGPVVGHEAFTGISEMAGRLQLSTADGGYLLQHGLKHKDPVSTPPNYILDIDAYRIDVKVSDVSSLLDILHSQSFAMFDWSLGEKARSYLLAESGEK